MHKDTKNTLFIIDGSSFLYRAYYGLKPLHSQDGKPIQAVYGFCRMIKKLIDMFNPEQFILVWDSKGKTTRHEIYNQYKATRQAPPSDLFEQKELIIQFADMISLKQLAQSGIEADDLIYSLMHDWTKTPGNNVVVISSDKDMGQMLSDHVQMYDSFKEEMITKTSFEEKMGFPVERIPFYFALLGDTSDNIPGVKGIGKQGATELVGQFSSLEDLYKNLDKVTSKRALTALNEHKAEAFLSEKLFLFQYHTTHLKTDDLLFNKKNWAHAQPLFQKLAFKSLLKDLGTAPQEIRHVASSQEKGYQFITVTTKEQLDTLCILIQEKKLFAYDTECDGLNPLTMELVGISLCVQERESFYIPVGHTSAYKDEQLEKSLVIKKLKPLFEDASIKKIAHHAKFDQHVIATESVEVNGLIFDTMIAAFLVKEEWQRVSLKELSAHYLQEPMLTFDEIVTQKKYKSIAQVSLHEATEYAAADAHQTFKLYPILQKLLQEKSMDRMYYDIELPLIQVLYLMEKHGIHCDAKNLQELDSIVTQKLDDIKKPILDLLGPDFAEINLNSPKQVEDLLFTHLKLPLQKKNSKSGSYSTDNEVLIELAKIHPIPGYIAQYRELFKLKTTYIEALPEYINKKTGNIHTSFSQIRTATGRLSSSEPNLQNIPIEGFGSAIRAAFKPESGHLFLSADYSQIELRVLAHLSKDTNLVNAFLQGYDIHAQSASKIFNVPLQEVTKHQRSIGKRINFSILYGLTPYGLSKDLDISLKDAKLYIDTYFEQYPKVRIWMDKVIEDAKKNGYVTTVHGRRRAVPGIYEKNKNLYELACRIAINTVAQGTAAEIMKIGMLRVEAALKKSGYNAKLLLQIHDELLISVAKEQAEQVRELVKQELESVVRWNIALKVNTALGANWQDTK
ncbi:DNA polymerase I [bacterium]|nr:DNA polymerase I [bacterium]